MTHPELVSLDALSGVNVGISVSESADLARLGLTKTHCDMAVAELSRAILLCGGKITYGGRLDPGGFTDILIDEVRRYGDGRQALTICVAESEHRDLSDTDLANVRRYLGMTGRIVLVSHDGHPVEIGARPAPADTVSDAPSALTAMRRYVTSVSNARVIVGGKLLDFQGVMPGVIQEAILSVQAGKPLYVAGGYGGAAAAIARTLGIDDQAWAPPQFPAGVSAGPVRQALNNLPRRINSSQGPTMA